MNFWNRLFRRGPAEIPGPRRFIAGSTSVFVNDDVAMTVSAFYRGVIYIATQIAKLPWEVKDKDLNVQDDKISQLLSLRPNIETNSFRFRLCMIINAIHHGNAYAEIQRDGAGRPIAVWPIRSQAVDIIRSESGNLVYRVNGGGEKGETVFLLPEDVYHIPNFFTKDGIVGQGVVAYAKDTLGISKSADKMASGIFDNGGIPSGTIEVPTKMSDEAYQRLSDSWKDQHGKKKAGGVAILEDGAKFSPVDLDPEALQFLDSRKFGVLEIARFLGLPPTKLYDTAATTYNNVEQANLEVAIDTLDSWARSFEIEADVKILNNRFNGRRSEMDLYSVFRGDMKTRSEYFSKMMQTGSITPNQIRSREGLAPYAGGNRYYIAVNNFTPADRLDEVIDAQVKKGIPPGGGTNPPSKSSEAGEEDDLDKEVKKATLEFLRK